MPTKKQAGGVNATESATGCDFCLAVQQHLASDVLNAKESGFHVEHYLYAVARWWVTNSLAWIGATETTLMFSKCLVDAGALLDENPSHRRKQDVQ